MTNMGTPRTARTLVAATLLTSLAALGLAPAATAMPAPEPDAPVTVAVAHQSAGTSPRTAATAAPAAAGKLAVLMTVIDAE
jgi:hypothetical protein